MRDDDPLGLNHGWTRPFENWPRRRFVIYGMAVAIALAVALLTVVNW